MKIRKPSRSLAKVSLFITLMGLTVIIGWCFDIQILMTILPEYVSMKFSTAICLVLSGVLLFLIDRKKTGRTYRILTAVLILTGGLLTFQVISGFNIGIDQMFVKDYDAMAKGEPYPGRPATAASIGFLLMGIIFLGWESKNKVMKISLHFFLNLISTITFSVLLGYFFNVSAFNKLPFVGSMAVHAALSFFVLSVSMSLSQKDIGIGKLFSGNKPGNVMARRLFTQVGITILILGYLRQLNLHYRPISEELATILYTICFIIVMLIQIWSISKLLNKTDKKREKAEAKIIATNQILEQEVELQTAQLRQTNEELRNSNEWFLKIFESNPVAMTLTEVNSNKIAHANNLFCIAFGFEKSQIIGRSTDELGILSQKERERILPVILGYLQDEVGQKSPEEITNLSADEREKLLLKLRGVNAMKNFEVEYTKKNGLKFSALISFEILEIEEKKYTLTSYHDISARKKNEEHLRRSEELFSNLFNHNPAAISIRNLKENKIIDVNASYLRLFGFSSREDVIGKSAFTLKNLVNPEQVHDINNLLLKNKIVNDYEVKVRTLRGEHLWLSSSNVIINIDNEPHVLAVSLDITERKKSENKFRNILEAAPDAIVILNQADQIQILNSQAEKLFGYRKDEIVGETMTTIITNQSKKGHAPRNLFAEAKNGSMGRGLNLSGQTKDGQSFPIDITLALLEIEEEMLVSMAIRDVSERRKMEIELKNAKLSAEQSSNLKDVFLANMSHEIRTPMNAIMGFTDLLLKRQLPSEEKEFVEIIKNSGQNLLRIVDDILDVSKIDSGMMTFEELPINIKHIFSSLKTMLSQKAQEKGLLLVFNHHPSLPDTVLGDPTRLIQIIINLVGNAIKFTKVGNVTVTAQVLSEDEEVYVIKFSVVDTGIGIPKDKLENIFERFTQAESSTTRSYGGTGLGLSIAKQLIELQGGNIKTKSTVGIGTEFTFAIPFKKTELRNVVVLEKNQELSMTELRKKKILIVEDNPINIKFVLSLFEEYAIPADIAENGKIAVEMLNNKHYDLLLMDIEMPEMNGYEATNYIRQQLQSSIPIVAMTAHAMAGEREKCLKMGMNGYVSKPIDADLLFDVITQALCPPADLTSSPISALKVTNLEFLIKSMKGRKKVIAETIELFQTQVPADLESLNEAIFSKDYVQIKKMAHKMNSTASIMGMLQVKSILDEMEALAAASDDHEKIKNLQLQINELCKKAMGELEIEKAKFTE